MSTRLYPMFQRGNPQLRVLLPNFNVFPVRPNTPQPPNVVTFHCSMKMTQFDIYNYITKIYKLPIDDVRVDIQMGELKKAVPGGYIIKDEDIKVAQVTLGEGLAFQFPDMFPAEKVDSDYKEPKDYNIIIKDYKDSTNNADKPGLPAWFS